MRDSIAIAITESSQTGEARRAALALASRLGFKETRRGTVGLVVTEVANNLVQHTPGGVVILRAIEHHAAVGIEILSLDRGPGMVNVDECLQDGFSTAGTAGNGLGAMRRLADRFDLYSTPDAGTALLVHLWSDAIVPHPSDLTLEIGAICLPKRGEEVSGDAWATQIDHRHSRMLVADGLGHGTAAAKASSQAVRTFHDQSHCAPLAIVEAAHAALRSTRGAALAIADIDFEQQSVCFVGVGNIAASVSSFTEHRNLVSHNGTVGHEVHKVQAFTYPWYTNGLLIMHSDGLDTQWRLDRYPGLRQKHPSLIAGVLYRDFHRDRDDVTVLVARAAER